jgi:hypothetical protein
MRPPEQGGARRGGTLRLRVSVATEPAERQETGNATPPLLLIAARAMWLLRT